MKYSPKTLANILAGIFALLFVVTTALAFVLYHVERRAFDADLYVRALDEGNFYERLPELTAQALAMAAQRPDSKSMLALFRNLTEEEWRRFVLDLLPPDQLRMLAEDAITQVIAYLNGESDSVALSFAAFKAYLQSPEGVNAIYAMLKGQPDCTLEQLTAMAGDQQGLTLCNPPDTFLFFDLRPIVEMQIRAAVSLLPEQVTILSADPGQLQKTQDLKFLRSFMRASPLLPMLCLLAITALVVRSWKDWLTWWGYPFLFAGLLSMSLSAMSGPLAALFFRFFVAPVLPGAFPADLVDVVKELTAAMVSNALQPILLAAGIMALTGLVMVALTFLLGKRLQNDKPER